MDRILELRGQCSISDEICKNFSLGRVMKHQFVCSPLKILQLPNKQIYFYHIWKEVHWKNQKLKLAAVWNRFATGNLWIGNIFLLPARLHSSIFVLSLGRRVESEFPVDYEHCLVTESNDYLQCKHQKSVHVCNIRGEQKGSLGADQHLYVIVRPWHWEPAFGSSVLSIHFDTVNVHTPIFKMLIHIHQILFRLQNLLQREQMLAAAAAAWPSPVIILSF